MRSLQFAGSALLALQMMTVAAPAAPEPPPSLEEITIVEAQAARESITLRIHGMMKSRSGAT